MSWSQAAAEALKLAISNSGALASILRSMPCRTNTCCPAAPGVRVSLAAAPLLVAVPAELGVPVEEDSGLAVWLVLDAAGAAVGLPDAELNTSAE
jgi:hypothetical protein